MIMICRRRQNIYWVSKFMKPTAILIFFDSFDKTAGAYEKLLTVIFHDGFKPIEF